MRHVRQLAIHGGSPITRESFPGWPSLSDRALREAMETLQSGRLTYWAGGKGRDFERRWGEWLGVEHAVSCVNGSAALDVALLALGIGPGDEVIVPSHSFIASAFAAVHTGAVPVFCDVGRDHVLEARGIKAVLSPRTRAVVVVHLYGTVCDMDPILGLAAERGLAVVEDCAQCVGGEYKGRKVGSLGTVGVFSFSHAKHLTAGGEGGMVTTRDPALAREARSIRDHGYDAEAWLALAPGGDQPAAEHRRAGFNYRLTEVQSAIAAAEMARLDSWNLPRRRLYARLYDHALSQAHGVAALPCSTTERRNAYWQYPLVLEMKALAADIGAVRDAVAAEGVPCSVVRWREAYKEPVFRGTAVSCPNAEILQDSTLVLSLHPTWEKSHVDLCSAAVKKVLRAFRR